METCSKRTPGVNDVIYKHAWEKCFVKRLSRREDPLLVCLGTSVNAATMKDGKSWDKCNKGRQLTANLV